MGFITTSVFDVFQAGPGPSSSHTIGPMEAAGRFRRLMEELVDKELQSVTMLEVRLFGSLSATGKGHGTDRAVTAGLMGWHPATCDPEALADLLTPGNENPSVTIRGIVIPFHKRNIHFDSIRHSAPYNNTLIMRLLAGKRVILEKEYYSVGGGAVRSKGDRLPARPSPPYPYACMTGLRTILSAGKIGLIELVLKNEEQISGMCEHDVARKLDEILAIMETAVNRGIHATGRLPGPIGLERKAA
ncbi:MAG: serine dehydratase beta chain, partial [Candidatus Omnitrophota bacterium]